MDDQTKPKVIGAVMLILPLVAWFAVAKGYYGFTPQTAHDRVFYMVRNTFQLWPLWGALVGGEVIAITGLVIGFKLTKTPFAGASYTRFYRGTTMANPATLARLTKDKEKRPQITIADVPIPIEAETTHFSIGGATGTGKSTIFKEMIVGVRRRGERMVILDPDGDYFKTFGRPGIDKILNPYDARTEGWSFFNEIANHYDFDRMAMSMIQPSKDHQSEEWNDYARKLLVAVAAKLKQNTEAPTIQDVYHHTNIMPKEELAAYVAGTPAAGIFVDGADKAIGSTRFVLASKMAPHMKMPDGTFSLHKWLSEPDGSNLFITWDDNMKESLRPIISTWADAIFSASLGLPPDRDRRIWVFLDELESLSYLPTLNDALTKGRKKGLCVVTGYQSYSQLIDVYGKDVAETMLSNHRTTVAMAVGRSGTTTAKHMSEAIGQHEIMRHRHSRSIGLSANGNAGEADDIRVENTVLPAEIMALPNLQGYLAFPGDLPVTKFKLRHVNYTRSKPVPGIVPREGDLAPLSDETPPDTAPDEAQEEKTPEPANDAQKATGPKKVLKR